MNIRASDQGGALGELVQWLAERNAASSGPRPASMTTSPVPAMANIPLLGQVPGLNMVSSEAGIVAQPGQAGLGAPMVTPSVAAPHALGLRVDALA